MLEVITNAHQLQEVVFHLDGAPLLAFDVETSPIEVAYTTIEKKTPDGVITENIPDDEENKLRGLDPFRNNLRLVQFCAGDTVYVVVCDELDKKHLKILQPLLDKTLVIGANLVFDMKQMRHHCDVHIPQPFDLMVVERMLTAGLYEGSAWFGVSSLQSILKKYLNVEISKEQRETFALGTAITPEQIEYAAGDVEYLIPAYYKQLELLQQFNMVGAAELENNALNGIVSMELTGMPISRSKWTKIAEEAEIKRRKLYDEMQRVFLPKKYVELLGEAAYNCKVVDPNSPLDVLTSLALIGLVLPGTKDQILMATKVSLQEQVEKAQKENQKELELLTQQLSAITYVIDYREVQKQTTTYGLPWLRWINPVTNKVHTNIHPYGAESGRNSSSKPNLQNIPVREHPEYRDAFCLDDYPQYKDYALIVCDWSGCELAILAWLSQDPTMLSALNDVPKKDLHILAASIIFQVDYNELFEAYEKGDTTTKFAGYIAKKLRSIAKNINFGIAYGIGPKKISEQVEIPYAQAVAALDGWKRAFPIASAYLDNLSNKAWKDLAIYGIANHRRLFVRPASNLPPQEFRKQSGAIRREGRNWPIQNGNGAMMKMAQKLIPERIAAYGGEMLMVIHDETISLCHEMVAEEVGQIVRDTMVEIGQYFLREDETHRAVHLDAELHIARYWAK